MNNIKKFRSELGISQDCRNEKSAGCRNPHDRKSKNTSKNTSKIDDMKLLSQELRIKIILYLSTDLSLLINADIDGMVTPKKKVFYFNSTIRPSDIK